MFISNTTFSFSSDDILDLLEYFLSKGKNIPVVISDVSLENQKLTVNGAFNTKILWISKTFNFKIALSNFFTSGNDISSTLEFLEPRILKNGRIIQKKITKILQKVMTKLSFLELNETILLIKLDELLKKFRCLTIYLDNVSIENEKFIIALNRSEIDFDKIPKKRDKNYLLLEDENNPFKLEEGKEKVLFERKD